MQDTGVTLAERAIATWEDFQAAEREEVERRERERRERRAAYVRRELSLLIARLLDPAREWDLNPDEAIELARPYLESVDLAAETVRFELDGLWFEFVGEDTPAEVRA